MGFKVTAVALNNEEMRAEISASLKLEIIHKLTSGFMDWNNCVHEEFNTGYMKCLIETVHILSEEEAQDEEIHR